MALQGEGGDGRRPSRSDSSMKLAGLHAVFEGKVIDVAEDIREREEDHDLMQDPLGFFADKDGDKTGEDGKGDSRRFGKRKSKKVQENIFSDFGKEHDSAAFQEYEVAGIILRRFNYKRFWQSDRDLSRWRQGLSDNTRFGKLLFEVRERWHTDLGADIAELTQEHNGLFRQRSKVETEKRRQQDAVPSPMQLRELQRMIKPKEKKLKKKQQAAAKGLAEFGFGLSGDKKEVKDKDIEEDKTSSKDGDEKSRPLSEAEAMIYGFLEFILWNFSTLEEAYQRLDLNNSGVISLQELITQMKSFGYKKDLTQVWTKIDVNHNGIVTLKEFMNLKPYMLQGMVTNNIRPRNDAAHSTSSRLQASTPSTPVPNSSAPGEWEQVEDADVVIQPAETVANLGHLDAPEATDKDSAIMNHQRSTKETLHIDPGVRRTLSMLIFKNGDPWHTGETIFMKRTPTTLAELLYACGEQCKPLILPVEALLDATLRPVRTLQEIKLDTAYLMKGVEALDPPPYFFSVRQAAGHSLRKLHAVKEATRDEAKSRLLASPVRSPNAVSSKDPFFASRSSSLSSIVSGRAGSPPWSACVSQIAPPRTCEKWKPPSHVAAALSWSGQGQAPVHNDYSSWPRLRNSLQRPLSDPNLAITM